LQGVYGWEEPSKIKLVVGGRKSENTVGSIIEKRVYTGARGMSKYNGT
jgi:hypothetical protein